MSSKRCTDLFIGTRALMGHLESLKNDINRNKLVCICIRSLMALIQKVPILKDTLGNSRVNQWAPWMLKFCFQFEKCCTEDAATETVHSLFDSYYIYGESDAEREITWKQRAENTNQILQAVVIALGGDCNVLIPEDTFMDINSYDNNNNNNTNIIGNNTNSFVSIANNNDNVNVIRGSNNNTIINNGGSLNYISPDSHGNLTENFIFGGKNNNVIGSTVSNVQTIHAQDGMTDDEFNKFLSTFKQDT